MIIECMTAGKHVICEKPFTGYFGRQDDKTPIGRHVAKSLMYERVMEEMDETLRPHTPSGKLFMYAEDWVYAPAVTKTAEILKATKDKILFMKGRGKPQRIACRPCRPMGDDRRRFADPHGLPSPFRGALSETDRRQSPRRTITVSDVTADVGNVAAGLTTEERRYIKANPIDVEDWGC